MKVRDLIEEARQWAHCAMSPVFQKDLIARLADALEAQLASRQPTEDDRELRKLAEGGKSAKEKLYEIGTGVGGLAVNYPELYEAYEKWVDHSAHDHADTVLELLDRLAALAAVPDAATEGRMSLAELEDIAETHAFCADRLYIEVENVLELRDECDAALAAVERIRQAVSGHPECDRYEEGDVISCGWKSAYTSVVAALDGAPEPEGRWEYRGRLQSCGYVAEGYISAEHAMNGLKVELEDHPYLQMDDTAIVERARVREWLPVEGESK